MKVKKRTVKYKKERVILSDVLPFEIPVTFSNRHFYDFLSSNEVELIGNKIVWRRSERALNEVMKLMFDYRGKAVDTNEIEVHKTWGMKTIPFNFKISHKENDFRELTIIHPKNQLALIDFYEANKELILHYCSVSPFSIRRAERIAKYFFHRDKTHNTNLSRSQDYETFEEYDKEYESLKTYFVYKNYSNIHKFYESYKYHRCEKKYDKLLKFDISKCFDSIYSHSLSWAILNKEIVKEQLSSRRSSVETFGGKFDAIMQNLNYGETNGIVIGPEFSRIFAELILQRVDRNVENVLRDKEKLSHKVDYEIFRYVDDYFVFYNHDSTKDKVLKHFRLQLKEFKLYLNDSKTIVYDKPIITEITIAKQRITELIGKYLAYKYDNKDEGRESVDDINIPEKHGERTGSIYVSSNKLITKFKTVIKETGVDYKDVLNYTLSLIERKVSKILTSYQENRREKKSEREFINAILEILNFTFFLYAVSPRVNTTIKLCRILRAISEFLSDRSIVNSDRKHLVFKIIYDNVYLTLQRNRSVEHTQVETLYLLIALRELGKEYWLDADVLRQYVRIDKNPHSGELSLKGTLNYFTIIVMLFYMKDKKRYQLLRVFVQDHIRLRFTQVGSANLGKCSELVFLLFDVLTCPFVDVAFKREILRMNGVDDIALQTDIIEMRSHWFMKWTNFDFGKELDAKHSHEVY